MAEGVRRFTALVAADNQAVIALLRSLPGYLVLVGHGHGALQYEIGLARPQECWASDFVTQVGVSFTQHPADFADLARRI